MNKPRINTDRHGWTLIKRLLLLLWLSTSQFARAETNQVTRAQLDLMLNQAKAQYNAEEPATEELAEAAERFKAAAELGEPGEYNLDALRLAEGMSLLKAGKPEEALEAMKAIEGFDSPEERSRLRLMRGNAHLAQGTAAAERKQWEPAKEEVGAAIDSFANALIEDPQSEAARHNLELAQRRLEQIKRQQPPPTPTHEPQPTPTPGPSPTPTPEGDQGQQGDEQQQEEQDQTDPSDPSDEESDKSDPSPQDPASGEGEPGEEGEGEGVPAQPTNEELDEQQAQQVLDAYLEQEKHQRRQILERRVRPVPVEKDW